MAINPAVTNHGDAGPEPRWGSARVQRVEAEIHASKRNAIDLIIEQAKAGVTKGYPENFLNEV